MFWHNFEQNHIEKRKALLALTTASFIWGASTPLLKWMLLLIPIFLLAFLRFFSAAILLLLLRPKLKIEKNDIPTIIFASLLGSTFHIPVFFWGLTLTSSINASILGATAPLITLLIASFYLKERIKSNLLLGGVIGIAGTSVILLEGLTKQGLSMSIFGNFLLLASTVSWVFHEMVTKKLFKKYESLTITFYTSLIGGLTFLPFAFMDALKVPPNFIYRPEYLIGIPVSIVFTSTVAYYLWQWGLSKLDVVRAGFFQYLNPVVGTIFSFIFLGEKITSPFVIGTIFIFGGLVIAEKKLHLPEVHLIHHILKTSKKL